MNINLERLWKMACEPERKILGLMSGTSLDGLDMALCQFYGSGEKTRVEILNFNSKPYDLEFQDRIRSVFSKNNVDLQEICLLNEWIAIEHADIINNQFGDWGIKNSEIDLIASHGQTIYHAPFNFHKKMNYPNGTLQIGDGDHIAQLTGIITLSDFRQKNLAAGGEGAPLAPYGDSLLFSHPVKDRILINIGGISNFTYLPSLKKKEFVFSSDLGAGNTLMDGIVKENFPGHLYDPHGEFAGRGRVVERLLEHLLMDSFFKAPFPKSTGPEYFNQSWLQKKFTELGLVSLPSCDLLATLNEFAASSIFLGIKKYLEDDPEVYISGGGILNTTLINRIQSKTNPLILKSTQELGIDPKAKEAVLFGLLANECIAGASNSYRMDPKTPQVSMGKISFPH